ncbi:MAG: hypothetical protein QOG12_317 [Verrucomicrobiota bacterium]
MRPDCVSLPRSQAPAWERNCPPKFCFGTRRLQGTRTRSKADRSKASQTRAFPSWSLGPRRKQPRPGIRHQIGSRGARRVPRSQAPAWERNCPPKFCFGTGRLQGTRTLCAKLIEAKLRRQGHSQAGAWERGGTKALPPYLTMVVKPSAGTARRLPATVRRSGLTSRLRRLRGERGNSFLLSPLQPRAFPKPSPPWRRSSA